MERYFKTEGNIIYPDKSMLTWGPFYYHSKEKALAKIDVILKHITEWVNLQDPSLDIKPEDIVKPKQGCMVAFNIKAWKDDTHLEDCKGLITTEDIFFEDEKEYINAV